VQLLFGPIHFQVLNDEKIPLSGNDSQIGHRACINDDINRTVKNCLATFRKRQTRRQKFLKQYKPKASILPVINNEEDTVELNTEEEAAFMAEALTIKRQFDEINVIETQVADIAHLTQQISENIEEQAELADDVHNNVKMTNENVREGNEQLLQATRSQSDFRVFSMIFLIGCSLTLLLLDAYK